MRQNSLTLDGVGSNPAGRGGLCGISKIWIRSLGVIANTWLTACARRDGRGSAHLSLYRSFDGPVGTDSGVVVLCLTGGLKDDGLVGWGWQGVIWGIIFLVVAWNEAFIGQKVRGLRVFPILTVSEFMRFRNSDWLKNTGWGHF